MPAPRAPRAKCSQLRKGVATWGLVLALGVGGSALAGCTAARSALGTGASPCFRAIPPAEDAVHHRGKLAGVRIGPLTLVSGHYHRLSDALSDRSKVPVKAVCFVAYRGTFELNEVERPIMASSSRTTGRFAIVVVSSPQNQLLGTFVVNQLPLRLRHDLVGGTI